MSAKKENNVTVGVRIRPLNDKEKAAGMSTYFRRSQQTDDVEELNEDGAIFKHWSFDHVFGEDSTNKVIFDSVGSKLVDAAIDGYNTVLFMYGQTSSGKTFTLFGDKDTQGLVDHAMEHLYKRIQTSVDTEFVVKLNYSELYNEELKDLLATTPNHEPLKIVDDPHLGPLIQGITEISFTTPAGVKSVMDDGEKRRHFGVTNMNAHSSRSHVMVRVSIETRKVSSKPLQPLRPNWGKDKPMCVSTLNLVDLAGSERANKSGTSGQALVEGSYINKSLLTLGTVISNLSEGKTQHIPYRNSRLTRLLASALGGNAKTTMITCISPAQGNVLESLSTLRFATRTKRVVNLVQKNELMSMKSLSAKLANQNAVIEQLRSQLELSRQLGFSIDDPEHKAESVMDKALALTRNWRNLKFVMTNGPIIAQKLRGEGRLEMAKKVRADVQHALLGSRDLSAIVDGYSDILVAHLPKERTLLQRLQHLTEENETAELIDEREMNSNPFGSNSFLQQGEQLLLGAISDAGEEELREELEQSRFGTEELRTLAAARIQQLLAERSEMLEQERKLKEDINQLTHDSMEKDETILRQTTNEANLQTQMEEQKKQHSSSQEAASQQIQQLMERIGQLELQLGDNESLLTTKNHEQLSKDAEIEKLRTQCDQLSKDLTAEKLSRKAFEEETSRSRGEMRIQMDRLRNNMHEMLIQGGQESKVMESHNEQLQKELDAMKDFLELETKAKLRYETEVQQLRAELAILREEYRSQLEAVTVSRAENADLSQKLRDARLENTRVTSMNSVLEQKYQKMQQELSEVSLSKEEHQAAQKAELKARMDQFDSTRRSLQTQLELAQRELACAKEELEKKAALLTKIEQTYQSDLARIEKKLAYQTKTNEELVAENANCGAQAQAMHMRHLEEAKALRSRVSELEGIVNSVNMYLEQQNDLLEPQQQVSVLDKYEDVADPDYIYQGSAYVRRSSFMMEFDDYQDFARRNSMTSNTAGAGASMVGNRKSSLRSMEASGLPPRQPNHTTTSTSSGAAAAAGAPGASLVADSTDIFDYPLVESIDDDGSEEKNGLGGQQQVGFYEDSDGNVLSSTLAISAATDDSATSSPFKHAMRNTNDTSPAAATAAAAAAALDRDHAGLAGALAAEEALAAVAEAENEEEEETDEDFSDSSEQFKRLLQGMNLITASMEHSYAEERIYRDYSLRQLFAGMEQVERQTASIEQLMDRQEFLEQISANLQDSLTFAKEKETKMEEQRAAAEQEYKRLKEQHLLIMKSEHKSQTLANTLEQQYLDMKVQFEKIKLENKHRAEENSDMSLSNLRQAQRINELAEEVSVLQSQLQLSDQEMGVLRVERDEAMQRLKFKPAHSLTSTSPHNKYSPSAALSSSGASYSTGSAAGALTSRVGDANPSTPATAAASAAALSSTNRTYRSPLSLMTPAADGGSSTNSSNNSGAKNKMSSSTPRHGSVSGDNYNSFTGSAAAFASPTSGAPPGSNTYAAGMVSGDGVISAYRSFNDSRATLSTSGRGSSNSGGSNGSGPHASLTYRPLMRSSNGADLHLRSTDSPSSNYHSSSGAGAGAYSSLQRPGSTTSAAPTPTRPATSKYDYKNDLRM